MKNSRTRQTLIKLARILADLPVLPIGIILIIAGLCLAWVQHLTTSKNRKPRLLWGSMPIKSLAYLAKALRNKNYVSETVVIEPSSIYSKNDFDYTLMSKSSGRSPKTIFIWMFANLRAYFFFVKALLRYDIFHYYFDGGILRRTLLERFELKLLRLAGKKIILMPYGGDAFVFDLIPDPIWRHALLTHYPMYADIATVVQKRIRRMTTKADVIVGCLVHFVNLPRWDILPLTCYPVDIESLIPHEVKSEGVIKIAHAPNHRGVKGTEYLLDAIERLQAEGYPIELDIIEKVPNTEAVKRIAAADIFVDQLVFGFALAALEALALGKIVISALENTPAYDLFRQYSYLKECPIVSAKTDTIYQVLKNLIQNRAYWPEIGKKSRKYVEKRHSYQAYSEMFTAIYNKIWYEKEEDLINYYHPLLESKRVAEKINA